MVLDRARQTRIPGAGGFRPGWRRMLGAGLAGALLVSCTPTESDWVATGLYRVGGSQRAPAIETLEQTTQYAVVPASRAMVAASDALVVLERNLGVAVEQRIILPNGTGLRGDNIIQIRAQTGASARLDQFGFDEVSTRFGGLPYPFQRLNAGELLGGEDGLGSFVYGRETVGADTVCVLVLRRLTVGARPMPRGTQAMDVMMRNCVNGTEAEALAPLGERPLGVRGGAPRTIYTLSPHAAPRL